MIIGVTGSFGSGKTTVARMLARLGAYVIDADEIYHALMRPSNKVYKKILRHFNNAILKKDRTIDRKKLAGLVFENRSKLNMLNRLVHPEVIKKINAIIRTRKKKGVIIVDAALLVESNFYKEMDRLVVVRTNKGIQVQRMVRARGMARKEILQRITAQAPLKKKLALADFIIDNSGSRNETKAQVEKIWKTMRSESWL